MRIKKYLLYFLVLVVAGAIAVTIFFATQDRGGEEISGKTAVGGQESKEEDEDASENAETAVEEEVEEVSVIEEPQVLEGHYTSSSTEFINYTFKCPEGWLISEENYGQTLMLSNAERLLSSAGSRAASENIMIIVEEAASLEEGPEGLIGEYLSTADNGTYKLIESFKINIGEIRSDVFGYTYESRLVEREAGQQEEDMSDIETDLITYITEGEHAYLIKYMGSGIDQDTATANFSDFLSGFILDSPQEGDIKAEPGSSMNILILGIDSGMGRDWGRRSARSDINMILHINLETYGATIVTIPRDMWVPIPGHNDGKINGAHAIGGPELAVETFELFSGLDIDNYIVTDFDGFIPLIDFLGGVTIEVNEDLADGFSNCYLSKGVHHLNGEQALALCRNRHRSGDGSTQGGAWAREREAAKVIKALYEQKTTLQKILALPAFADFLLRYTWTDLDFLDLMRVLPVLGNIGDPEIELRGVPSYSKMIGKASAVVHYEDETEQLFEEIKNQ